MGRFIFIVFLVLPVCGFGQIDSILARLSLQGDFRFRIEQDWSSRKSDGSLRDDRSRLRYRLRFGFEYQLSPWASFGARIRTGLPTKQQDPQLTLGDGFKEFSTLPIGFEKAYFEVKPGTWKIWMGKNTYPFEKNNELFWSDNVFPEGVFVGKRFPLETGIINEIGLSGGHFLVRARGTSFNEDSYYQAFQVHIKAFDNRLSFFPTINRFANMPNIPDGLGTFDIDYTILDLSLRYVVVKSPYVAVELDYFVNLQDYTSNDSITTSIQDQNTAFMLGIQIGKLERKGDWATTFTFNYQEQFSAVDYMAQNDWVRWDYSSFGSLDGRLTNYRGIEIAGYYAVHDRINLVAKYYLAEQIVPYGEFKETGSRFRFDVDVRF